MTTKRYEISLTDDQIDSIMLQEIRGVLACQKKYKPVNETDRVETKRDIEALERVLFYLGG